MLPSIGLYRTYPGREIRLSLAATDPDGGCLRFTADSLPAGAALDDASGLFTWVPTEQQLGPFYIAVTVSDDGEPPLTDTRVVTFKVSPPDMCSQLTCDPAAGCEANLISLTQSCCEAKATIRVAEPAADCPDGRVMFVGGNQGSGFGRLQNCDRFRVTNFGQIGAVVRFNLEARCLNISQPVTVHGRLQTATRVVFDAPQQVMLQPGPDGFAHRTSVAFLVRGPGPFFEFEGAEAEMDVTISDADGVTVSEQLRLVLTFMEVDDLPDLVPPSPPGASK